MQQDYLLIILKVSCNSSIYVIFLHNETAMIRMNSLAIYGQAQKDSLMEIKKAKKGYKVDDVKKASTELLTCLD